MGPPFSQYHGIKLLASPIPRIRLREVNKYAVPTLGGQCKLILFSPKTTQEKSIAANPENRVLRKVLTVLHHLKNNDLNDQSNGQWFVVVYYS